MNVDKIETLVRLVGVLVVLASLQVGQSGRWPRVRQRLARALASASRTSRGSSATVGPSSRKKSHAARERWRAFAGELAISVCLAILLLALAMNLRDETSAVDAGRVHVHADF